MADMLHWILSYHGFDFLITGTAEHRDDWLAAGFSVQDAPLPQVSTEHQRLDVPLDSSGDLLDLILAARETGSAFSFRIRGTREDLETWRAAGLDVGEIGVVFGENVIYEIRPSPFMHRIHSWQTFSIGIGVIVPEGRRKPAAIYRVRGFANQVDQVRALAERLVHWLNHPERDDVERCPSQVRMSSDGDARIILTKAGRDQGWLPAGSARGEPAPDPIVRFSDLKGHTLLDVSGVNRGSDCVRMRTETGLAILFHRQDCCESVEIEEVIGNVDDIIGDPLLIAEESQGTTPNGHKFEYEPESYTWTFYRLGTIRGTVVLRWLGESNGYYSEEVDFEFQEGRTP